jgi:hypothetical protein
MKQTYRTDPKEVYTLELQKLQRSFSDLQRMGEEVSDLSTVSWRQVEHLRQINFILQEATQTGESLLNLPSARLHTRKG